MSDDRPSRSSVQQRSFSIGNAITLQKRIRKQLGQKSPPSPNRSAPNTRPTSPEEPSKAWGLDASDKVILVMGPSGSGKSTFISTLVGRDIGIGHALTSHTSTVTPVRYTGSFKELSRQRVVLVDTPGFDDTVKDAVAIFEIVANFLRDMSVAKIPIAGVLYLHRISDNRYTNTASASVSTFQKICGKKALSDVILVTTMWDEILPEEKSVGEARQKELESTHWKQLIDLGARASKFPATKQARGAMEIVFDLLRGRDIVEDKQDSEGRVNSLRIQKEVNAYHLGLSETSAGQTLYSNLSKLMIERQGLLDKLEAAMKSDDPTARDRSVFCADSINELQRQIKELEAQSRSLDAGFQGKIKRLVGPLHQSNAMSKALSFVYKAASPSTDEWLCMAPGQSVRPGDIVILVVGRTGAGKSQFIADVTGKPVQTNTGLDSCTSKPAAYRCPPQMFSRYGQVVLVDTVGFDNSTHTDGWSTESHDLIQQWCFKARSHQVDVAGALYLHKVDDSAHGTRRDIATFTRAWGRKLLYSTSLVTTQWDCLRGRRFASTNELLLEMWQPLLLLGAKMRKSNRTLNASWSDKPSAEGKETDEPLDEADAPPESNQAIIQRLLEGREREMKPGNIVNETIVLLAQWTLNGYAGTAPSTLDVIQLALYVVVRTFLQRPLRVLDSLRQLVERTPIEKELHFTKDHLNPLAVLERDLAVLIAKAKDEKAPSLAKKLEDLALAIQQHPLVLLVRSPPRKLQRSCIVEVDDQSSVETPTSCSSNELAQSHEG